VAKRSGDSFGQQAAESQLRFEMQQCELPALYGRIKWLLDVGGIVIFTKRGDEVEPRTLYGRESDGPLMSEFVERVERYAQAVYEDIAANPPKKKAPKRSKGKPEFYHWVDGKWVEGQGLFLLPRSCEISRRGSDIARTHISEEAIYVWTTRDDQALYAAILFGSDWD
jgi:hypothetical protein